MGELFRISKLTPTGLENPTLCELCDLFNESVVNTAVCYVTIRLVVGMALCERHLTELTETLHMYMTELNSGSSILP